MTIELTDEAREWLVKNGYDEAMGARPMARVIQTQIKTPLADEVLFGRLRPYGNGTGEGNSRLDAMRLLRVTSKLAMLPFWRTSGADGAQRLDDVGTVIAYA